MRFTLNFHLYNSVNFINHIVDNVLVLIYLVTRSLYLLPSSNFLSYHPSCYSHRKYITRVISYTGFLST